MPEPDAAIEISQPDPNLQKLKDDNEKLTADNEKLKDDKKKLTADNEKLKTANVTMTLDKLTNDNENTKNTSTASGSVAGQKRRRSPVPTKSKKQKLQVAPAVIRNVLPWCLHLVDLQQPQAQMSSTPGNS